MGPQEFAQASCRPMDVGLQVRKAMTMERDDVLTVVVEHLLPSEFPDVALCGIESSADEITGPSPVPFVQTVIPGLVVADPIEEQDASVRLSEECAHAEFITLPAQKFTVVVHQRKCSNCPNDGESPHRSSPAEADMHEKVPGDMGHEFPPLKTPLNKPLGACYMEQPTLCDVLGRNRGVHAPTVSGSHLSHGTTQGRILIPVQHAHIR